MRVVGVSLTVLFALGAYAELQNVAVHGEIRIRGRYWHQVYSNAVAGPAVPRYPAASVFGRALGPFGTASRFDFDDRGNDLRFVEMRTRVGVTADFTNEVTAFIQLESYDLWGEDFRSDYGIGADRRASTTNDVEVYQSYIEAQNIAQLPLRLRIGRQELRLGKGWLVDEMATAIVGRSWDALRATYTLDRLELDAWWSKLTENSPREQDGDVDFYGVYGTYRWSPALQLSAYWMLVRDARALEDTGGGWLRNALEALAGLDDYDPGYLHTVGVRLFGAVGNWDYDAELAYQFGDADPAGSLFAPFVYGDDDAEYGFWAGDAELGYRVDAAWQPRVFAGGAFFEGDDHRDLSMGAWLLFGLRSPEASLSFNRLFPGKPYSLILGINQELSNFWQLRIGASATPLERVTVGGHVAYLEIDDPFQRPYTVDLGRIRVPLLPFLSFATHETSKELGWQTMLWARYAYSDDVSLTVTWEHLFVGEGLSQGHYFARNGLQFVGGTDNADADYLHFDLIVRF